MHNRIKMVFIVSVEHPQVILEATQLGKFYDLDLIILKRYWKTDHYLKNLRVCYVENILRNLSKIQRLLLLRTLLRNVGSVLKFIFVTRAFVLPLRLLLRYLQMFAVISSIIERNAYRYNIIVIYAHWAYPAGLLGLWLKSFLSNKNTKLIVSLWGYDIQRTLKHKYGVRGYRTVILKEVLTKSDKIIVNHRSHEIIVRSFLGDNSNKIVYLEPGIPDLSKYTIAKNVISSLGINTNILDKDIILYAPSLRPIYGIREFINAIPIVVKEVPNVVFLIVGEGELLDEAREYVKQHNLDDKVYFLGRIEHETMLFLYRISKVVCDLAYPGPGTTALEALCHGRPVIAIRALKFSVINGYNGFLIKKGDYKNLAKYIIKLLKDEKLWKTISNNARESFLKYYHIKNRIDKIRGIVMELISS